MERALTGRVLFVDNLSESLTTAAGDALYAQTLFIMLAVPGALVALGLAYLAALGTAARDRRDLVLLRTRGASRQQLLGLAVVESLALGLVAGLLGAGLSVVATSLLVQGGVGLTPGAQRRRSRLRRAAFAGALAARIAASAGAFGGSVGPTQVAR